MFQADCDLEDISNFHHISTLLDFRLAALAILISRVELVGHLVWMMPQNWFIMAPISASIVTGCSRLLHFSIPVARQHQINKINNKLHLHFAPTAPTGPNILCSTSSWARYWRRCRSASRLGHGETKAWGMHSVHSAVSRPLDRLEVNHAMSFFHVICLRKYCHMVSRCCVLKRREIMDMMVREIIALPGEHWRDARSNWRQLSQFSDM